MKRVHKEQGKVVGVGRKRREKINEVVERRGGGRRGGEH